MTFVVTEGCLDIKDKACVEECPVDCLYEGERMMYIHPVECIDCGACLIACPQEAIVAGHEADGEEALPFAAAAVAIFDRIGSPGGAAGLDGLVEDAPYVRGLPRR
jgi:NAD-dependent dihydropyrimidine dehydrogenase PreA subunit